MDRVTKALEAINSLKSRQEKADEQKRTAVLRRYENAKAQIKMLKPNIDNLCLVFQTAISNGIDFKYHEPTPRSCGGFISEGFYHRLGFHVVNGEFTGLLSICSINDDPDYDLVTNGDLLVERNNRTKYDREIPVEHTWVMENFLKAFQQFEEDFYDYIENATTISPSGERRYYIEVCDCNGDRVLESRWFETQEEAEKWWEHTTLTTGDYNASLLIAKKLSEETNDYDVDFLKYLQ